MNASSVPRRAGVAFLFAAGLALSALALPGVTASPGNGTAPVDFSRDVRPLLSDRCFRCHGNDEPARRAGLRLDRIESATAELESGRRALVPGDAAHSALVERIESPDPERRMPPADSGKELSAQEIALLRRWVEEGAEWSLHWAFRSPRRAPLPEPANATERAWSRGPIDDFVAARRLQAGLEASPEADRATLLRRLSLDLTGMPPTLAELDAFFADQAPQAYERQVDRLLASPRYGEQMARSWLDAARYADTHGLHLDNERSMWPWRQWVIEAFDANMPFDEFTIEQLAGDLLPDATDSQRIASGFNRNNPTSAEGGMIAAEYDSLYAKDRVETTSTVFLGLTMACTGCHDHKFDPLTMRDYYSFYAFFNNLTESASDQNIANPAPFMRVASPEQRAQLDALRAEAGALEQSLAAPMPQTDAQQLAWEREWHERLSERWQPIRPELAHSREGSRLNILEDGEVFVDGESPDREVYELEYELPAGRYSALRLDALCDERYSKTLPGRAPNFNFVLSELELELAPLAPLAPLAQLAADGSAGDYARVSIGQALASFSQDKFPLEAALDGDLGSGWAGLGKSGDRSAVLMAAQPFGHESGSRLRVRLRFESVYPRHDLGRFRISLSRDDSLLVPALSSWSVSRLFAAADGRASFDELYEPESAESLAAPELAREADWQEQPDWVDGKVHTFDTQLGSRYLWRRIESPRALELAITLGSDDGVKAWLNGELVHANPVGRPVALDQDRVRLALRAGTNVLVLKIANFGSAAGFAFRVDSEASSELPPAIAELLGSEEALRSAEQATALRQHYRSRHAPEWARLEEQLVAKRAQAVAFEAALPTTLISEERPMRRPAFILKRGQYDAPGEEVEPATPRVLPPMPEDAPRNRLGLARWLVGADNPLTARVSVNRFWQQMFGTGLVATSEDFGSQGEWPSHPELLDWLALDFVESGWDVKALLRRIVTSATYRQSSRANAELLEVDPSNRLLARGPRYRLPGEVLRDQALALGGLLIERVGGPSVRPYQPPGIWFAVGYTRSNTARFEQGQGEELYRRSLYSFWKRTAPPPSLATFDAPSREACRVRRARTNTPLQALVTMNDVQFVEAARHFAARILREGGATTRGRIQWAFRSATSRFPEEAEIAQLHLERNAYVREFAEHEEDARALIAVGDSPVDEQLEPVELAAWTCLASLLLNLDETLCKP